MSLYCNNQQSFGFLAQVYLAGQGFACISEYYNFTCHHPDLNKLPPGVLNEPIWEKNGRRILATDKQSNPEETLARFNVTIEDFNSNPTYSCLLMYGNGSIFAASNVSHYGDFSK